MEKVWDVAIIGSGPSALTAAIYTTRGAVSTLILAGEKWGGQLMLTTTVDNFPGFPEGIQGPLLMENMKKQALRFGAEFVEKNVASINTSNTPFEVKTHEETYKAKSIIIATGAETVWLNVPGLSKLIGRGVSSCAPCDAPFFREKIVAVVGGGDSAMEEADVLTRYAKKVILVHRRSEFRASKAMQEKVLKNPKVEVVWDTEIVKVNGEAKVASLTVKNNKTNKESDILVDGLFVAIGHKPQSDIFKGLIETDERGFIKIQEGSKTNVPGVFVAGDVHDYNYKQAITASGFGCQAAMELLKYLEKNK